MPNKNFFTTTAGIIIAVLVVLCCCAFVILASGLGGWAMFKYSVTPAAVQSQPLPTPIVITRVPVENIPADTLGTLEKTDVPVADLNELACRLRYVCGFEQLVPSGPHQVGDQGSFWVHNADSKTNFQIKASLDYMTGHVYYWIEDGVRYDKNQLKELADTFESKIYPTDRDFFGSEWSPGIDNDAHIYILLARGLGRSILGYYSSFDEYPTQAYKFSNAHEMFNFNANLIDLGSPITYGVLAHEFQHMIHWHQDRNESTWINEGFAVLAMLLNKYPNPGYEGAYIGDTDVQLNDWSTDPGANGPHYGASFLYLTYFLDRFGDNVTRALVHNPLNGLESIDDTLKSANISDKLTGKIIGADDVFADWAVTNYLHDGSVGDGRYVYHNFPDAPRASAAESISYCPAGPNNYSVHQYGVDYIEINCSGNHTLHFEGSTQTGLLPVDAHSGKYAVWSNKGDESDMTLTREFDFSTVSAPLTMTYQSWYDLEKGYDYVYVEASSDNGKSWKILKTPSGSDQDTSGNSYGWGYTGMSGGGDSAAWINETLDLSAYAGQKVQIRFEYITDPAVNGEGFLLDDIAIPAVNYSTDFEKDDGGWQAKGFARVENILPQTYRLELIVSNSQGARVQNIVLNPEQSADIPLALASGDSAILVVSGVTRFTREEAHYSVSVR